jgi:hypothetical protein
MGREDLIRAAKARAAAARSAMRRAVAMTTVTRAVSDDTVAATVIRLRAAAARRCDLCSGRIDIGRCTCTLRCLSDRCTATGEISGKDDEASIP